jgi:hypothetical protein
MLTINETWCLHSDIIVHYFHYGEINKMEWNNFTFKVPYWFNLENCTHFGSNDGSCQTSNNFEKKWSLHQQCFIKQKENIQLFYTNDMLPK